MGKPVPVIAHARPSGLRISSVLTRRPRAAPWRARALRRVRAGRCATVVGCAGWRACAPSPLSKCSVARDRQSDRRSSDAAAIASSTTWHVHPGDIVISMSFRLRGGKASRRSPDHTRGSRALLYIEEEVSILPPLASLRRASEIGSRRATANDSAQSHTRRSPLGEHDDARQNSVPSAALQSRSRFASSKLALRTKRTVVVEARPDATSKGLKSPITT